LSGNARGPALKKRDEADFRAAQAEIEQLRSQAAAGSLVLGYLDEAGFSCVHPNRSAWTKVGTQHLIPAVRGQRLNVLGALMSTGHLESVQFTGSMTSALLLEFLADMAGKYTLPVTLVVDNASMHRSKEVTQALTTLELQGIQLYFLPPYSPELNRIEKLWQQMKYVWMAVKSRTIDILNQDVAHILDNFGTDFKLAF
jgi:transposase